MSRRRDMLSFGHHAEVAALAGPGQDFWLRKAEEHRWPVKRLRQEVSASLAERRRVSAARQGCIRLPRGKRGRHTNPVRSFDELITEGSRVPVDGWDFSWFEGRASEERPPWGYARLLGERMAALAAQPGTAALDLQTGGGEVLASIPAAPPVLVATECWPPNVEVARRNLARLGASVVPMDDELADLPFEDATFDLVVSRHPVGVRWDEIARVLKPGGAYFSQGVGERSVGELTDFLMGPQPPEDGPTRAPKWSVLAVRAAGLELVDLREFRGRMEFCDIAAVVHFLRKVVWTVPDFTVDAYADRLRVLHEQIERAGPFVATSVRFLIEARKPT